MEEEKVCSATNIKQLLGLHSEDLPSPFGASCFFEMLLGPFGPRYHYLMFAPFLTVQNLLALSLFPQTQ